MDKDSIETRYLALHDTLGSRKDAEDKELFDQQHAEIWANCDLELQTRKAELEAKDSLTSKELVELAELEALVPSPPPPDPDYARACELLAHSPVAITQPEMWELLRIFGKRLGYERG